MSPEENKTGLHKLRANNGRLAYTLHQRFVKFVYCPACVQGLAEFVIRGAGEEYKYLL